MLKMIDAVLFDLDGTLIDSAPDLGAAADQMRLSRGLPSLHAALYRPMAGAGARGMIGVALGKSPADEGYDALKEEFFRNYEQRMLNDCRVFDGVAELLSQITASGLKWGIVTNKSLRFTNPIVRAIPLFETAQTVISGDTTAYAKPHPEPLFEAARQLGALPARCVYVGDDKRDIDAAIAAGMPCLAAIWGYLGAHDVRTWNADALTKHPLDVLRWLKLANPLVDHRVQS